jgi:hypothetical protein
VKESKDFSESATCRWQSSIFFILNRLLKFAGGAMCKANRLIMLFVLVDVKIQACYEIKEKESKLTKQDIDTTATLSQQPNTQKKNPLAPGY